MRDSGALAVISVIVIVACFSCGGKATSPWLRLSNRCLQNVRHRKTAVPCPAVTGQCRDVKPVRCAGAVHLFPFGRGKIRSTITLSPSHLSGRCCGTSPDSLGSLSQSSRKFSSSAIHAKRIHRGTDPFPSPHVGCLHEGPMHAMRCNNGLFRPQDMQKPL